ncbi:endopeptidase PepO [Lactobacillus selangorensis]|uniref:Endopeptidase PepO n=1 Tax=Lactobacillus selangorensis TaxID=81857 RepID=A0A0R2FL26_9LACO|nr:M13 family metallopeptidase [Lactobacillus selangorensis]KRN28942.1 endopeptidase PepO [Lactobacillus selangorensis]KRN32648.1 endopeptidase PepO [Lactobacillus selangorensis]
MTNTQVSPQENLYDAVNGQWEQKAVIPADHSTIGGFTDLSDQIEKTLMDDFAAMLDHDKKAPKELDSFLAYYKLAADFKQRNAAGVKPAQPYLDEIEGMSSLDDLVENWHDMVLDGMPLPFVLDVDADMKNATINALYAYAPSLILPDKSYYSKENEAQAKQLLKVFFDMMSKLFEMAGLSAEKSQQIINGAIAFDKQIVPYVKSAEEKADYSQMYHLQSMSEFTAHSKYLPFGDLITSLIGKLPDNIIVPEPDFYAHFDQLVNPEHFGELKDWMLVQTLQGLSGFLSDDFRTTGGIYGRVLSGSKEAKVPQKSAYYLATGLFDQVVGDYYAHAYFGDAAKKDVHSMVEKMIAVYKKRLKNNDWLSAETRTEAVKKLDHLGIQVGFPDKLDPLYKQFVTKPAEAGGDPLNNAMTFNRIRQNDMFKRWDKKVDRNKWEMSANTVNAYYHPFRNIIVFPAAILQAPFYSLKQSASANFGGIGAVIAHEISHAFDNNGALFDEYGNLNNWWTKEDSAHFKQLSQAMIDEFNGIPFANGKVNGKLTVSENIADAGGLSCALEAAKGESEVDLKAFFENWARVWRNKSTEQRQELLLAIDVHAPAKLRANVQVKNLDDFYTTFDVQPGDGMYMAPEKRVHIW